MRVPGLGRLKGLLAKAKGELARRKLERELSSDPLLRSSLEDGLLRVRITNACNAKCRYCGIKAWKEEERRRAMEPRWLYEFCVPLYARVKTLLLTGGDAFVAKESWNYCEFISEKFPRLTLMTESNGIAFSEKWRELAARNLFKTHFSLNATNETVFKNGVWEGEGAETAFRKARENVLAYLALLRREGLELFAPSVSMVVNKDTACDVGSFARFALESGFSHCVFYFDYTESDMGGPLFGQRPEASRAALKELMKLERVLAGKFFIYFRLWIPVGEVPALQREVDSIPLAALREEYAGLLELAEGRSMRREFEERQRVRAERGKKVFLFDEDWTPTIRQMDVGGKRVCAAPWKMLDIYPDGMVDCCGWIQPQRLKLLDFVEGGRLDENALFNSREMRVLRRDMLNDDFNKCMSCCPLNSSGKEASAPHKYGFDRPEAKQGA